MTRSATFEGEARPVDMREERTLSFGERDGAMRSRRERREKMGAPTPEGRAPCRRSQVERALAAAPVEPDWSRNPKLLPMKPPGRS